MVRRTDSIDSACEEWALAVRRMEHPQLAKEHVGALRCTLAARRDLHHGSRSGKIDQQWPEFPFQGVAATVNVVYRRLPACLQEIMVAHYVALTPRSKSLRADLMGLSVRLYWERVGRAKAAVSGAFAIVESVRTVSGLR
jgi:hypothetical protein